MGIVIIIICFCEMLNSFMTGTVIIIETSPLICRANQWTSFYMITASVMKDLIGESALSVFSNRDYSLKFSRTQPLTCNEEDVNRTVFRMK